MSQDNVELLRAALRAFNRGDRPAFLALCDPDYENFPPRDWPESAPTRGREAVWDFFNSNMEPWDGGAFELGEVIDAPPDRVAAEQRALVRGSASGANLAWSYWHVITIRARRAVRSEWFGDRAEALEAAGVGT